MFAPKVVEPQKTATARNSIGSLARQRPLEQSLLPQSVIGNKATRQLLLEQRSSNRENVAVPEAARRASWDFSKIPTLSPRRANLPEMQFPSQESKAEDIGEIAAPTIVHQVLRSPGQPLDSGPRALMESRFGYDFSGVRVHSGAAAGQSARDVSANAYTVGQDIVFGAGRFAPNQSDGQKLLAHELAHVVQQARPGYSAVSQRHCEQDADNAAESVGSRNAAMVQTSADFGALQRQPETGSVAGQAVQKKSRLVRVERYWRSPNARAFFEDGTNEEVTFVEASSLDPATQPEGTLEKAVDLIIDRSSPIRPHVEFATRSSRSKVTVATRPSPADRISRLPAKVRGEVWGAFLGDTEVEPDPETMEFAADMGDRLKESSSTTKIEMEGQDPAKVASMREVDQWMGEQKGTLDKVGPAHQAKFTHLLNDIRQIGVTGPVEADDLDAQDIELVLAGAAGGQSDFQTFGEFKRIIEWQLRSGKLSLPQENAHNPELYIRNEYRKAWKAEAAGLRKMSRIAAAAQVAPFAAIGASAVVGTGGALLEVGGAGLATWTAARGISSRLLAKYVGTSLFAAGAVTHFGSAREEAEAAGMDPNSPSGIANTVSVSLLRAMGLGEVVENVQNRSMLTQKDLNRSPFERITGAALVQRMRWGRSAHSSRGASVHRGCAAYQGAAARGATAGTFDDWDHSEGNNGTGSGSDPRRRADDAADATRAGGRRPGTGWRRCGATRVAEGENAGHQTRAAGPVATAAEDCGWWRRAVGRGRREDGGKAEDSTAGLRIQPQAADGEGCDERPLDVRARR